MKITTILVARAIRGMVFRQGKYLPDMFASVRERYGFVHVPTAPREILPPEGQPFAFAHGRLRRDDREILISKVEIFPTAVLVETAANTDDSDIVIDDIAEWATAYGLQVDQASPPKKLYVSHVELHLDYALESCFAAFRNIGAMFEEFFGAQLPYGVISLGMNFDQTKVPVIAEFRLERRAGAPHEFNNYFSQAPLNTDDHTSVLREIDASLQLLLERGPVAPLDPFDPKRD